MATLAALATLAGVLLGGSWTGPLDQAVAAALLDSRGHPVGGPVLVEVARDVTALGSTTVLALVTFVGTLALLLYRRRELALRFAAVVLLGWPVPFVLKLLWARPRPQSALGTVEVFTHSFPSAHAFVSALVYGAVALFLIRALPAPLSLRRAAFILAILLTFAIGLTRMHLGVHHPSVVVGGWLFATAWLLLAELVLGRRASPLGPGPQAA